MNKKLKVLKLNMLLNTIKGIMGIIFPLLSFPYVSKILGVENLGRYNFAYSIVSYFLLLAGLGINTYAIREGARIRDNYNEFNEFVNEMFSINIISTGVSYILFIILLLLIPQLHGYSVLLVILSIQMIFRVIGIDWVYTIYEDYIYITTRSIIFQCLSLLLLFTIVKSPRDLNLYSCISVIASVGSNVLNYFHSRKYCHVHWTTRINWKKHLKPIMILFAMSVTVTIYVSSDTTILGFICGDAAVGIYSVSTKIYSIVKTILSSILVVSIPSLSSLLVKSDKKEFNYIAADIYSTLLSLLVPCIVGIISLRREIVCVIADISYIRASTSLALLSIALFFCMCAWFWGQAILVPLKLEKEVFRITLISAFVNILLNFILIPIFWENAAALTTIIAEGISFAWCAFVGKKYVTIPEINKILIKIAIGCASFACVIPILREFISNTTLFIVGSIIFSCVIYIGVELVLKNSVLLNIRNIFQRKESTID